MRLLIKRMIKAAVVAAAAVITSQVASAQTIRVMAGTDEYGITNFIEAFEYDFVPEKPSFPGGEAKLVEFINQHRHYPPEAYKRGIQGRVTCWFIVNADGSISNVSLLRSVNEMLNEEAIRIFSIMPDWVPGRINGIAVPVRVVRSVRFRK